MKTIRFTTCNDEKAVRETRIRPMDYETENDMISRAVKKLWGAAASWWSDSGLGLYYGQIVGRGGNCLTYRLRCDID